MRINIYNAFTKNNKGGNPAGIVFEKEKMEKNQKLEIAKTINLSETVFIKKINNSRFKFEYFTPTDEVDLCGHATIAGFKYLLDQNIINIGKYILETKAGILEIEVSKDTIFMEQSKPKFLKIIEKKTEIANSLNLNKEDLINKLPIQIVSTGLKDILVGVKNNSVLNSIIPDFKLINKISKEYNVVGYHVYSLESSNGEMANCRNFAPLYGINEESATGTSSGALASFLYKYNRIKKTDMKNIKFLQGKVMKNESGIYVNLKEKKGELRVFVGGKAKMVSNYKI